MLMHTADFSAWSLSFYPQVFNNWRRKSVEGGHSGEGGGGL